MRDLHWSSNLHSFLAILYSLVFQPDQVPLDENLIVCRYIDNPLVIDGKCISFRNHTLTFLKINCAYASLCVCVWTQTCTTSLISPDDVTWDASLSSDGGSFQFFRPESDCMHLLPGGPTWSLIGFNCIYHIRTTIRYAYALLPVHGCYFWSQHETEPSSFHFSKPISVYFCLKHVILD